MPLVHRRHPGLTPAGEQLYAFIKPLRGSLPPSRADRQNVGGACARRDIGRTLALRICFCRGMVRAIPLPAVALLNGTLCLARVSGQDRVARES